MIIRLTLTISLLILVALICTLVLVATPALAIDLPDSAPVVESINAYRNILETGDTLIIIYENTPYATTPDTPYDDAFIWRLYDTDGTTEIGQATGFPCHEDGYGYNVISFYFDAGDAPAWEQDYYIRLVGTPAAFATPPTYTFQMNSSDYYDETASLLVKAEIADMVILLAESLNSDWGLVADDYLTDSSELLTVLSLEGEAFFRGAIYGIQAMAEGAFSVSLYTIDVDDRTWSTDYQAALSTQLGGTDIGTAMDAGNTMFDSSYNLFGIIGLVLALSIFAWACIAVGGDIWATLAICAGLAIIGTRMGLMDLVTIGLITALAGIFVSGKMWKVF